MEMGAIIAERFELIDRGGQGGMGTVYRARDLVEGRDVALKVLNRSGPRADGRFAREARVLATLSHPAMARYVAHGSTPAGLRYLAMEWFDGVDLAERLREGTLSLAEVITLGTRVAGALAVAHTSGVVHRDIKPSNILLKDGAIEQVKVIDFGIARLARFDPMTHTGQAVGTPRYMAPEQARGDRDVDSRADVYSLGCVLFACLTGRHAFEGNDARAVLAKILLEEPPRVRDIRPELPAAVDEAIASMMAKEPGERPANCQAVADLLQRLDDGELPTVDGLTRRQIGLGYREQRLTCLVFVAGGAEQASSSTDDTTLPTQVTPAITDALPLYAEVRELGGRLERLADGSHIITLAGAESASAEATRAARCALALRPRREVTHMALATARRDASDRTSLGDMIDRAASALADHSSDEDDSELAPIFVDPVSAELLAERFDIVSRGDWLELRAEKEPVDITRTLLGKPTPCVGRTRELGILRAIFEDCVEESAPRAVLITGPPGMGKSRIRYEFTRRLEAGGQPFELLIGRGDPLRAGAAFALLGRAVRRAADVRSGEDDADSQAKLLALVGRTVRDPDERARIAEFLGELVGVRFPDDDRVQLRAARHDASVKGEQMRRAWEDWIAAECDAHPVILVLEDLHWGDWPTVKFVGSALRNLSDRPFMVLALARPGVKELLPNLWEGRGVMEIELTPLSHRASEKLVRDALGPDAAARVSAQLAEQAGGNAFFLEELIRVSAEGRPDVLPESVLAVVQARLDRLPAEARLILRAASVFGGRFWKSGLAVLVRSELDAGQLDDWLDNLIDREVISLRRDRKFPDEDEYVFRHALMREAAYAMLTDDDRRTGHRLAGQWLHDAGEVDAMVLAEHYERGDQPGRAVQFYVRACEQALAGSDHDAAIARALRGLACLEAGEVVDVDLECALALLHARALGWKGRYGDAQRRSRDALERAERGGPAWCAAAAVLANASGSLTDHDTLVAVATELCALGDAGADSEPYVTAAASAASQLLFAGRYALAGELLGHIDRKAEAFSAHAPGVAAVIYRVLGVRAICNGDLAAGLHNKSASVTAYEQAGDHAMAQQQRGNLGSVYVNLGAHAEAEALLEGAVAQADAMELPSVAGLCRLNLASACAHLGKLDRARQVLSEALASFELLDEQRMMAIAHADMSGIVARTGDLAAAEEQARRGVTLSEGTPPCVAYSLAKLADILLAAGRAREALDCAREAMAILEMVGGLDEGEAMVRLVYAEALHATGDTAAARDAVEVAHARLQEVGDKISDPRWRASFFDNVPENRRTAELYAQLVSGGR